VLDNKFQATIWATEGGAYNQPNSSALTIPLNTWIFAALTVNERNVNFYYDDGTGNIQEDSATLNIDPHPFPTEGGLMIGNMVNNNTYEFDSYMDSVRYYDSVLTQAELQEIYNTEKP